MIKNNSKIFISIFLSFSILIAAMNVSEAFVLKGKLNINTAAIDDLLLLPGIGREKAKRIIELKNKIKLFKRLDDLLKVKGLGKKLFDKMKPYIKLAGKSDLSKAKPTKKK